jgi:hypothetical protein
VTRLRDLHLRNGRLRDPRLIAITLVGIVLAGAAAFGLWHVVVGGLLHGNARAASFGLILATLAGALLALLVTVARRLGRA